MYPLRAHHLPAAWLLFAGKKLLSFAGMQMFFWPGLVAPNLFFDICHVSFPQTQTQFKHSPLPFVLSSGYRRTPLIPVPLVSWVRVFCVLWPLRGALFRSGYPPSHPSSLSFRRWSGSLFCFSPRSGVDLPRSIQASPVKSSFDLSVRYPGFLLLEGSISLPGLLPFRRVGLMVLAHRGMVDNPSSRKQPNAP